ncbi:MAG TPA: XrtA/PEP-CTERM system exopolysaccharide export protein [Rhodanobacteraceae bacterium]|nr:XrtA/PEP-CTERM system exopolysaccharide export protein [Rhodanobacteraceae bacterium]
MRPLPRNPIVWLIMTAALLLLGACSTAPTVQDLGTAAQAPERYIIGPGDQLEIYVRDNPNLSTTVPVRPDGRISIPLVQSIQAAGKTPDQLASDLQKDLGQYIRSPIVTVIVKSFVGTYSQQVRVVGQAAKPMALTYRSGMTLLDVMIDVGGLTKFAAGNSAKIVRHLPNGSEKTIPVRLEDLMNGSIKDNVAMRPGDILIIPQSLF